MGLSEKDEESVWEVRRKVGLQAMITTDHVIKIPLGDKIQVFSFSRLAAWIFEIAELDHGNLTAVEILFVFA